MVSRRWVGNAGTRPLIAKTCAACCKFKMADEYRVIKGGYRQSICKACQHTSAKKADLRRNHKSWDHATNAGEPWSERDEKRLLNLDALGVSRDGMGIYLGRSSQAIQQKLFKLRGS